MDLVDHRVVRRLRPGGTRLVDAVAPRLDIRGVRRRDVVLERGQPLRFAEVLLARFHGDRVVARYVQPKAADRLGLVAPAQVVLPRHQRHRRQPTLRIDVGVELDLVSEGQEVAASRRVGLEVERDECPVVEFGELGETHPVRRRQIREQRLDEVPAGRVVEPERLQRRVPERHLEVGRLRRHQLLPGHLIGHRLPCSGRTRRRPGRQ